jgi:hypothetical protein
MLDVDRQEIIESVQVEIIDIFEKLELYYRGGERLAYLKAIEDRIKECAYENTVAV